MFFPLIPVGMSRSENSNYDMTRHFVAAVARHYSNAVHIGALWLTVPVVADFFP